MKRIKVLSLIILSSIGMFAQTPNSKEKGLNYINESNIRAKMRVLASDWMEGREVGTKGGYMASEYVASIFQASGIAPYGDPVKVELNRYQKLMDIPKLNDYIGYVQKYPATKISEATGCELSLTQNNATINFTEGVDFKYIFPMVSGDITNNICFAGYGYTDDKTKYNDYDNIDVEGKVALILKGLPGDSNDNSEAHESFKKVRRGKSLTSKKIKLAKENGATGVIFIDLNDPWRIKWNEKALQRYNDAMYEGDKKLSSFYDSKVVLSKDANDKFINIEASLRVLNAVLDTSELSKYLESSSDLTPKMPKVDGTIVCKSNANIKGITGRNILGYIKGKTDKTVVVGGHFDHLGMHDGYIWNGADDNASGAIAVMCIAEAMVQANFTPTCNIVFACWDGEERGLLGSKYFVSELDDKDNIKAYLNFDMIGRNTLKDSTDREVAMIYTKSFEEIKEITDKENKEYTDLYLTFHPDKLPVSGSDNASFAYAGIPIYWFLTQGPSEYHQPSDHKELIDYKNMTKIIKLAYLSVYELAK